MNCIDDIRLEQFRQLKEEIRSSEQHLIIGIDVAKEKHHAFFGTARGKTLLKNVIFDNTIEGFEKLDAYVERVKTQYSLPKVVFGIEPTADYHKPLAEHLLKCSRMVVLVGGAAVKHNRSLLNGRWDKNDDKDSSNIADLIAQGKCMFYEYPLMTLRNVRVLNALKRRLKKREHGLSSYIRNHLLAQYFPELDKYYGPSETLAVVRECLDPSAIAGMEYDDFCRTVAPGKMTLAQERRVGAIWRAAVNSIGCTMGESAVQEAQLAVDSLKQVRQEIKSLEDKLENACLEFPEYTYLLSIPGFGPDVSAKVLGAIGDPHRFTSGRQVLKLAGFDLCAKRSGKTSNSATPIISKQGKADLRCGLYQAAFIASIRSKDFMPYFTNKLAGRAKEKGIGTKMRVKLAAKLLIIAWTLMKKKELFDPKYLKLVNREERKTAA
jgi:transposase